MSTAIGASHGIERTCYSCKLTYRYPANAARFTCKNCGGINDVVEQPNFGQGLAAAPTPALTQPSQPHELSEQPTAAEAVPLIKVLRHLNSMSSDKLRQLHDQLAVIQLVDDANRWRLKEPDRYEIVRRILGNAGIEVS